MDEATPSSTADARTPDAPEGKPFLQRVLLTFTAPGALGDALRARPAWLDVAFLGAVLLAVGTFLIPPEVWESSMRSQAMAMGQPSGDQPQVPGEMIRIFSTAMAAIMWFVILFIFSGIMGLIFAFILGDRGGYRNYLAAVAHGNLVGALGALLVAPLKIAQADPQLTLSVGTFMEGMLQEGFLLFFLRGLDFFALWSWVVIAILVSRIDERRSVGSALAVVLSVMLVIVAIFAWFGSRAVAA